MTTNGSDFDLLEFLERLPSDEHVVQEAIGGSFIIDRVCKGCNDKLGSIVDAPLLNSDFIKLARYALGVKGGSKKLPCVHVSTSASSRPCRAAGAVRDR